MASSMNLSLADELSDFIEVRAGDGSLYSTPSEYLRDLIRRDMEAQTAAASITSGLDDLEYGCFSEKSILGIASESQCKW